MEFLPQSIIDSGRFLQQQCHGAALKAGWWQDQRTGVDAILMIQHPQTPGDVFMAGALVAQKLALIHSEISEGLEGYRKGRQDEHLPHRSSIEVELADAVIRTFDLAGALGLDLGAAIAEKMAYNQTRADHKPEARAAAGGKAF
jgi:NTP pyrophosphatase (non-canonical NTP hydrolase)